MELTGMQERQPLAPSIDLGCDFVMVYGVDETMPRRVREYAQAGYRVHLMTGISWGDYQDYLDGQWDGKDHWDESQRDRNGRDVIHNPRVPYMVPTLSFIQYLIEKLKPAVDSGVSAIHVEEPEFWNHSGYSPAFRREYEKRYQEPFAPQHASVDAHFRCARLKAEMYARAIRMISAALKDYAKVRYGRDLRFYVPTHSLVNYSQWKIISPESAMADMPTVDGFIAQVWTGTSRSPNIYEGRYRERTFETAYLEYGAAQALIRGGGRQMWFLHDPIEDNPAHNWEDYRKNYEKTAAASLLHPQVSRYEICPWPRRVFEGSYPRVQPHIKKKDETSLETAASRTIPEDYRTFLCGMFQFLGDLDGRETEEQGQGVGVFLSDTAMFERSLPDDLDQPDVHRELMEIWEKGRGEDAAAFLDGIDKDGDRLRAFAASAAFPCFFGLAMPLLKYGLPVRPLQLENVVRFPEELGNVRCAVLSYELMKPASPAIHDALSSWVREGGALVYVGDGADPFHGVRSWWKDRGYDDPSQHLLERLGLPRDAETGVYPVGKGLAAVWRMAPARIGLKKEYGEKWRAFVKAALERAGVPWAYQNYLILRRGPYLICHVMDESTDDRPLTLRGTFADLTAPGCPVIREKQVGVDESAILCDLERLEGTGFAVIFTAGRILEAEEEDDTCQFRVRAADQVLASIRVRLPWPPAAMTAMDDGGEQVNVAWDFDAGSSTALITYCSQNRTVHIAISK